MITSNFLESDIMTKPPVIRRPPTRITQGELQCRLLLIGFRGLSSFLLYRGIQARQSLVFVLVLVYMHAQEGCSLGELVT